MYDDGKSTRVGWANQVPKKIICHASYARDHISPQFPLKLFQFADVVPNYESLTIKEKKAVPDTLFEKAKFYLVINGVSSKMSS